MQRVAAPHAAWRLTHSVIVLSDEGRIAVIAPTVLRSLWDDQLTNGFGVVCTGANQTGPQPEPDKQDTI